MKLLQSACWIVFAASLLLIGLSASPLESRGDRRPQPPNRSAIRCVQEHVLPAAPPQPAVPRTSALREEVFSPPERSNDSWLVRLGPVSASVREVGCAQTEGQEIEDEARGRLLGDRFSACLPSGSAWRRFPDAYPGADLLFAQAKDGSLEEFAYFRSPGVARLRYEVVRGPGAACIALTPLGSVEVRGGDGNAYVRMAPPHYFTRTGERRAVAVTVDGVPVDPARPVRFEGPAVQMTLSFEASPDDYPILVDPLWQDTASLTLGRMDATSCLLMSGDVLMIGGVSAGTQTSTCEEFAPGATPAGTWTVRASMNSPRSTHVSLAMPSGRILVAGGAAASWRAELYDPGRDSWELVGATTEARWASGAALLADGRVVLCGGGSDTAELYDPVARTFTQVPTHMPGGVRTYLTCTLLGDGRVLVHGGRGPYPRVPTAVCDIFDPASNGWATGVASLRTARTYHTAHLQPDGRVLVSGGNTGGAGLDLWDAGTSIATAELYDSTLNQWSYTASNMSVSRAHHTGAFLLDGRTAVFGDDTSATGETFSGGFWTPLAEAMPRLHNHHTTTLLLDGTALVASGRTQPGENALESPLCDRFRPTYVGSLGRAVIQSVNGVVASPVSVAPGAYLQIHGSGFGAGGAVRLFGTDHTSKAHVHNTGGQQYSATLYSWSPTTIMAQLPADSSGVVKGLYYLWVIPSGSDPSAAWILKLADTTPPKTTFTSVPPNPTSSTTATFAWVSSKAGSTFERSLDGGAWVYRSTNTSEQLTGLLAGQHDYRVRATDLQGNVEQTPADYPWTIQP